MLQLTPLDASFIYMEGINQYMHIAGMYIYDPSTVPAEKRRRQDVLGHKDILDAIERTLHLAPNMRRKLVSVPGNLDHPYWVEDKNFDIEFHVRHMALPKPGDWQQLCILAARLFSRPLDVSKPLWETYIIENLDNIPGLPPGCFATLNKVHHAAIDGVSGIQQMMGMHSLSPDEDPPEIDDNWEPEEDPNPIEFIARAWLKSMLAPTQIAEISSRLLPGLLRTGRAVLGGKIAQTPIRQAPRTRFNHMLSPHRVFDARIFDLKEIKAIKNAVEGSTVNDVVLAICGGALRKYLLAKKDLPKKSMSAMIPMNVRTEEENYTGGNIVSAMVAAIGTDIADPVKRLQAVRENTKNAKDFTQTIGAREISSLSDLSPAAATSFMMNNATSMRAAEIIPPFFNLVISNVPGAQVPLYMGGSQLMVTFGLGPNVHGTGLFIAPQSYNGVISISFNACRAIMPDPQFFAECIMEAKNEFETQLFGKITTKDPAELVKMTTQRKSANGQQDQSNPDPAKAKKGGKKTAKPKSASAAAPRDANGQSVDMMAAPK